MEISNDEAMNSGHTGTVNEEIVTALSWLLSQDLAAS